MEEFVLEMVDIDKRFSGVHALKKMNLQLRKAEVHALLGENGAGKSTLIKILGGIYKPDEGEIRINGEKVAIEGIRDAKQNGISIIHQEIVLVPHLTVAENIFLGREKTNKLGFRHKAQMEAGAQAMMDQFGLDIDAKTPVFRLTIAQQQLVEIVKAVSFDAKIIVMDEPTSSIADHEVEQLFAIIRNLKERGVSVIYISHRLQELFAITDRITVMRDGEYIETKETARTDQAELVKLMVGRALKDLYTRSPAATGETVFEARGLTKKGQFAGIDFHVNRGEIVGFAGLVGAGRSEIMEAIFGITGYDSGEILIEGQPCSFGRPRDAIRAGIGLVSEDRKKTGLVLINSVEFNLTLAALRQFIRGLRVRQSVKEEIVGRYVEKLSIKTPSPTQKVYNLSGGNQQKIVIGKWLAVNPKILILDEPTRGVDIGAKAEIYAIMDKLAAQGLSIIMISSELPELINMADRIYCVHEGRISGELLRGEFTQEKIMHYATGGK